MVQKRILFSFESFCFYRSNKGQANLELAFCLHGDSFECFRLKDDRSKNEKTLCGQRNLTMFDSDK